MKIYLSLLKEKTELLSEDKERFNSFPISFDGVGIVKKFTKEEKEKIFEKELELISNYDVYNLLVDLLDEAPDEFWYKPNQSEYGETNPDEKGMGGLILHIKRAVSYANDLCDSWGLDDCCRDIVIGATLLHDIDLDSFNILNHEDVKIHHHLIEPRIKFHKFRHTLVDHEIFDSIMEAIEGHMGDNCIIPSLRIKGGNYLSIVHMADRLANTKGGNI